MTASVVLREIIDRIDQPDTEELSPNSIHGHSREVWILC